jgi:T-complex protein 1 subunit zeta
MQIQHPTASLIARASTAQDDKTTSTVLIIGELLKQADIYIAEGLHPRMITEGFDKARTKKLEVLDIIKIPIEINKENLFNVACTSLRTKAS